MAWPSSKDLSKYAYKQFKGHFLGFIVGTSATSFVSTFFETRKISNLWGLTSSKTIVSGDTFRFLEWFCALVVGFIAFVVVNNLVKERIGTQVRRITSFIHERGLMSELEGSAPRTARSMQLIARSVKKIAAFVKDENGSAADAPKTNTH
jgi:Flp pilus assembly pilin Flp